MIVEEQAVKTWIINNLDKVFPGMTLVSSNEVLSDRLAVDLHLKDKDLVDVFVEIKTGGLRVRETGRLLNHYSVLSNLEEVSHIRFIVILPEISEEVRGILTSFGVEVRLISELSDDGSIPDFSFRELRNVLTPVESEALAYVNRKKCCIVDVDDLSDHLGYDRSYASKILERLEKKEYLERIKRGRYLYIPLEYGYDERYPPMNSLAVGSVLVEPYYYGYQTANRFHGYTSQFSPITYICTTKTKRSFRWKNTVYRFVKLVEEKFFGYERRILDGCEIFVAEPEKAVLDSLDKPEYCGGAAQVAEVVSTAYRKGLDNGRLLDYVARFGSQTVIQRLGYMTDFLDCRGYVEINDDLLEAIEDLVPDNVSNTFLGPVGKHGRSGSVNSRWHIVENFEVENLLDEVEVK